MANVSAKKITIEIEERYAESLRDFILGVEEYMNDNVDVDAEFLVEDYLTVDALEDLIHIKIALDVALGRLHP